LLGELVSIIKIGDISNIIFAKQKHVLEVREESFDERF